MQEIRKWMESRGCFVESEDQILKVLQYEYSLAQNMYRVKEMEACAAAEFITGLGYTGPLTEDAAKAFLASMI